MSPYTYRSCNQTNKQNQLSWLPFSSMGSGKWPELPLRTTPWDCDRWRGAETGHLLLHECLTNILNEAEVGLEQCCTPFNIIFQHRITESTKQRAFTVASWSTDEVTFSARLTFPTIVRGWSSSFRRRANPAKQDQASRILERGDSVQISENLEAGGSQTLRNLIRWA